MLVRGFYSPTRRLICKKVHWDVFQMPVSDGFQKAATRTQTAAPISSVTPGVTAAEGLSAWRLFAGARQRREPLG